jgi:DMSO/TMAO reductase YedYZ heme-binding membrane subunit
MTDAALARRRSALEGARVALAASLAVVALAAACLLAGGAREDGLGLLTRVSARAACLLFLAAWTASSLRRLAPVPATAWLLRNRRALGLAYAFAMLVHAAGIGSLAWLRGDAFEYDLVSLAGGGSAYAFTAALAATSTDRAVARLGARRWRALHRVGVHWIFFIFAFTELPRALESPLHGILAALLVASLAVRVAAARSRRGRMR